MGLKELSWKCKYSSEDGDLLNVFYQPALEQAVRYDRTTGFFSAEILVRASRGIEHIVLNHGHMRLIVGCTLPEKEYETIRRGEQALVDSVEACFKRQPLLDTVQTHDALELLAWMVENQHLEVKVAIPCDRNYQLIGVNSIFHEKAGIIEDNNGAKIAFNGSVNETVYGWTENWESFHVYTSWDEQRHLDEEENSFYALWNDKCNNARVLNILALRDDLLRFLPKDGDLPKRLQGKITVLPPPPPPPPPSPDPYEKLWNYIRTAPSKKDGGELVGEATSAVIPWAHQIHAFDRMYHKWPPRLLIADEVGLGKTVQAGLLLRQAWLAGKAKRILILTPKAVLQQWQRELREKFNLNWPIYADGKLAWFPSPALRSSNELEISIQDWHKQPFILMSAQLACREDRRKQILEDAAPWDIVILDEAHHARRQSPTKADTAYRPNNLLRLMDSLRHKTQGLILLTATPMQVDPIEVYDLLRLLGLPQEWNQNNFMRFFEKLAVPLPSADVLAEMAVLFRASEETFGQIKQEQATLLANGNSFVSNRILKLLRDSQTTYFFRNLDTEVIQSMVRILKAMCPTKTLISRHTRELLRKYYQAGKIYTCVATRDVQDVAIPLSPIEASLYSAMENYISTTYNATSPKKRTAVGFVMTSYRKRLASSFYALQCTLKHRLEKLKGHKVSLFLTEDDTFDDEDLVYDGTDKEKLVSEFENNKALTGELEDIELLLKQVDGLPLDSKTSHLLQILDCLDQDGYDKVIIFTQYTDTLIFLRNALFKHYGSGESILCYSGRGGEQYQSREWKMISREETKRQFKDSSAKVLLCTDAAAEGLNFQFCGALINYDSPWNPMKVEQRIGRIDRLGQKYNNIRIYNLLYENTVETDVYYALKERISLFTNFVGKLQPILSKIPKLITDLTLNGSDKHSREEAIANLQRDIQERKEDSSFDIDDISDADISIPNRPKPLYDMKYLDDVLKDKNLSPRGVIVRPLEYGCYGYQMQDKEEIRVTTDIEFYENYSDDCELWSPGSPAFPWEEK